MTVHYDARDKILVAGTLGRGAWTLANADLFLKEESQLRILGSTSGAVGDQVVLRRNAGQPWLLDVFLSDPAGVLSAAPIKTMTMSPVGKINVDGRAGNDDVLIDGTNGPISPGGGIIANDSGGVADVFRIENHVRDCARDP